MSGTAPRPEPFASLRISKSQLAMGFEQLTVWFSQEPVDDMTHLVWGRFNPAIATHRFQRRMLPGVGDPVSQIRLVPMLRCTECGWLWKFEDDPAGITLCTGPAGGHQSVMIRPDGSTHSGSRPPAS